jgi:hypothetical protein
MKFLGGEMRGWEIPPEDILPYTPGSKVECILMIKEEFLITRDFYLSNEGEQYLCPHEAYVTAFFAGKKNASLAHLG